MSEKFKVILFLSIAFSIALLIIILFIIFDRKKPTNISYLVKNLEKYTIELNISKKRISTIDDLIDLYILTNGSANIENLIHEYFDYKQCILDKYKDRKIYNKIIKKYQSIEPNLFTFIGYREVTRYSYQNYIKTPYRIKQESIKINVSPTYLEERIKYLKNIQNYGYSPINTFDPKKERTALTKELREKIKRRDNYTCRMCGKKMYDEVGLQIDHIIPISKGGRTVESNLQVLCSKCNAKKGDKVYTRKKIS